MPIDAVSPSPETPIYNSSRFDTFAPVMTDGIRPWTELKPWALSKKYVGDFDEQPMPDTLATRWGSIFNPQTAWITAALIESCPQPAHKVEIAPS